VTVAIPAKRQDEVGGSSGSPPASTYQPSLTHVARSGRMDLDGEPCQRTLVPMAQKKTGDPRDGEQHVGGGRFMPVHGMYGVEVVLPGPLTVGRPKPEPEERWTLAPGHHHEPATEADEAPAEPAPVEPVKGTVARPAAEDPKPGPA